MLKDKQTFSVEELLAKAKKPSADAMMLHPFYRGKVETALEMLRARFQRLCHLVHAGCGCTLPGNPSRPGAGLRVHQQMEHGRCGQRWDPRAWAWGISVPRPACR